MSAPTTYVQPFIRPRFLTEAELARLHEHLQHLKSAPATVTLGQGKEAVKPAVRNTQAMRLPQATRKLLAGRFDALRTELTAWFGRPVGACQPPDILSYGPGSFFRPHTDTTNDPLHPQIRARDLTAVLFLSDPQHPDNNPAQDERYAGGRLLLHRSTGPATETDEAMDVTGPAGTLVAFPATTRHEVTPVTAGQRLTAVAWYTAT